jgi:hypothetical protein
MNCTHKVCGPCFVCFSSCLGELHESWLSKKLLTLILLPKSTSKGASRLYVVQLDCGIMHRSTSCMCL